MRMTLLAPVMPVCIMNDCEHIPVMIVDDDHVTAPAHRLKHSPCQPSSPCCQHLLPGQTSNGHPHPSDGVSLSLPTPRLTVPVPALSSCTILLPASAAWPDCQVAYAVNRSSPSPPLPPPGSRAQSPPRQAVASCCQYLLPGLTAEEHLHQPDAVPLPQPSFPAPSLPPGKLVVMVHSLHLCLGCSPLAMVAVSGSSLVVACFPSVLNSALQALFRSTLALESLWCLCCMTLSKEMVLQMAWSSYS